MNSNFSRFLLSLLLLLTPISALAMDEGRGSDANPLRHTDYKEAFDQRDIYRDPRFARLFESLGKEVQDNIAPSETLVQPRALEAPAAAACAPLCSYACLPRLTRCLHTAPTKKFDLAVPPVPEVLVSVGEEDGAAQAGDSLLLGEKSSFERSRKSGAKEEYKREPEVGLAEINEQFKRAC